MANIITLIGGGGKTSLMYFLAGLLQNSGIPVVVTTTTKMRQLEDKTPDFFFAANETEFLKIFHETGSSGTIPTIASRINGHDPTKVEGFPPEFVDNIARSLANACILVEGDGSAGKSLKGHMRHEPVIPKLCRLLLPVVGADIFGKPLNSFYTHRAPRIAELTGRACDSVIDNELIISLLFNQRAYLHNVPAEAVIVPVINKVEHLMQYRVALELTEAILRNRQLGVKGVMVGSVIRRRFTLISYRFIHNLADLCKKLVNSARSNVV